MKRNYNINNNLNFSEMEAKNNAESLNSDYPESPLSPPEEQKSSFTASGIKYSAGDTDEGPEQENSVPEETNPPKQDVLLASL